MWPGDRNKDPSAPAPRNDNPTKSVATHDAEQQDPFDAFHRFANKQFHRLISGLEILPHVLSDLTSRFEEHNSQNNRQHNLYFGMADGPLAPPSHCLQHGFPKAPAGNQPTEEAKSAVRALLLQAYTANTGIDRAKISRLYTDDLTPVSGFQVPAWLSIDWFEHSPYSPSHIERHPLLHQRGSMWRAAFEDLLAADLGKTPEAWTAWTNRTDDQRLFAIWAQAPRDWMLGLQCRGLLPPQLPNLYHFHPQHQHSIMNAIINQQRSHLLRPVSGDLRRLAWAVSTFDNDELKDHVEQTKRNPETEQDLYEAFLGDSQVQSSQLPHKSALKLESSPLKSSQACGRTNEDAKVEVGPNSIVSTLTTTERVTLPDGTTTTKMLLKKRFADGREESSETSITTHGQLDRVSEERSLRTAETKPVKSKTWFWT